MKHRVKLWVCSLSLLVSCGMPPGPVTTLDPATITTQRAAVSAPSLPKLRLKIRQAEIAVAPDELNRQFSAILAMTPDAKIRDARLTPLAGSRLSTTGKLKFSAAFPEVPFELEGPLTIPSPNVIRFEAQKIKIAGIPLKAVLDAFGVELSKIAQLKDSFGRVVQNGNNIDMVIEKFTSDTQIDGSIKRVATSPDGLTLFF